VKCLIGRELRPGSVISYTTRGQWYRMDVNIGLVLEVEEQRLKIARFTKHIEGGWAASKRPVVIRRVDRVVTVATVVDAELNALITRRWAEYYQG